MKWAWQLRVGLAAGMSFELLAGCGMSSQQVLSSVNIAQAGIAEVVVRDGSNSGLCSAVVVGAHTVLTAAHCVDQTPSSSITVTAGSQATSPTSVSVHPDYLVPASDVTSSLSSGGADVALLTFSQGGLVPSAYSLVWSVPSLNAGADVLGIGFGLNPDGTYGSLRSKMMQFGSLATATAGSGSVFIDGFTLVERGSSGDLICSGDSGGPLLMAQNNQPVVFGIAHEILTESSSATTALQFCTSANAAAYTSLAPYAQWLSPQIY